MTWEEIILKIRQMPEYRELVELAYFDEDLKLNAERFKKSEEFAESLKLIRQHCKKIKPKVLDIGAGNGIASIAFALHDFDVTAIDPDTSSTVGTNAIRELKKIYQINSLEVIDATGEKLPFENETFDVVYIRQAMHHAAELPKFVEEASRVLKKNGIFFSVRDHVIYDEKDKKWFLDTHPLHKFYGGENAYTFKQYKSAIESAGLKIIYALRHFDSVINYFPMSSGEYLQGIQKRKEWIQISLNKKLPGFIASSPVVMSIYEKYVDKKLGKLYVERNTPGRLISFLATK